MINSLKGYVAMALDAVDNWVLRHKVEWFCNFVAFNPWMDFVPDWYAKYWNNRWERMEND